MSRIKCLWGRTKGFFFIRIRFGSCEVRRLTLALGPTHTTPEEFENATKTGQSGIAVEEYSGRVVALLSWCRHRFRKVPLSKYFLSIRKRKALTFKFLRFKERFQKPPYPWRISVDGRPNRRNKAAFSNFSRVGWALPYTGFLNIIFKCIWLLSLQQYSDNSYFIMLRIIFTFPLPLGVLKTNIFRQFCL